MSDRDSDEEGVRKLANKLKGRTREMRNAFEQLSTLESKLNPPAPSIVSMATQTDPEPEREPSPEPEREPEPRRFGGVVDDDDVFAPRHSAGAGEVDEFVPLDANDDDGEERGRGEVVEEEEDDRLRLIATASARRKREVSTATQPTHTPRKSKSLRSSASKYNMHVPKGQRGRTAPKPEIPDVDTVQFLLPSGTVEQRTEGSAVVQLRDHWQQTVVKSEGRTQTWLKAHELGQCLTQAVNKSHSKRSDNRSRWTACDTCVRMRRPCIATLDDANVDARQILVLPEQSETDENAFSYYETR